jgi:hypothetical protein
MVWPDRKAEKQKIGWILLSFLFFLCTGQNTHKDKRQKELKFWPVNKEKKEKKSESIDSLSHMNGQPGHKRNRERDTVAWLETIQCGENPKGNKEIWELREMS